MSSRVRANPEVTAILVYAGLAVVAIGVGYLQIFSHFERYDDEGTLLIGLKAFVGGHTLYSHIWSVYGPFYYELFGAWFKLTGSSVTNDAGRAIVLVIWVATSLLYGLVAQRLTGRLWLGITAFIVSFAALQALTNEPMHPQGLAALLFAALLLISIGEGERRVSWRGAWAGALIAAILLTKVNLGVFAIAGVGLAAALTVAPFARLPWVRRLVVVAFLAVPIFILLPSLNLAWVKELLAIVLLCATALIVAAWPRGEVADSPRTLRWLVAAVAGFLVTFLVIFVIAVATGPSPSDIYQGIVVQAFGIHDLLLIPVPFPGGATVDWAIVTLVAAILARYLQRRVVPGGYGPLGAGLARILVGVLIWLNLAHIVPITIGPPAPTPILPMLLCWVAALRPRGVEEGETKRFVRVLLPAIALAQALQIYPVAGSQLEIAAVVFAPVGALCIADGLGLVRAWSAAREDSRISLANFALVAGVATTALAAVLFLNVMVLRGSEALGNYRNDPKLLLPGADRLRLEQEEVEEYSQLVTLLHENHCTTFISYPGFDSLYLWSGLEAPQPYPPNAWMRGLNDEQQRLAVKELRASPRPCVIAQGGLIELYDPDGVPEGKPLLEYLLNDFELHSTVGEFTFFLPKPSATRPG